MTGAAIRKYRCSNARTRLESDFSGFDVARLSDGSGTSTN
jgi:hypothetical protein